MTVIFKLIQNIRNLIRPNKQVLNHSDFIKVFEDLQGKIQEYQVAKKEGKKDKKPKINYSLALYISTPFFRNCNNINIQCEILYYFQQYQDNEKFFQIY